MCYVRRAGDLLNDARRTTNREPARRTTNREPERRTTNLERRTSPAAMSTVHQRIVSCTRCPRLRTYCAEIARTKRRAYRDEIYWGKPVPGFGDPRARLLIVGLAPAAHGANRTGRVFTGDGVGGSGDFLMSALHRAGFANLATSHHVNDGLKLRDVFIAAAVRCAPPDNKPTPEEIARCLEHLVAEVAELRRVQVVVTLGRIGFDAWLRVMRRRSMPAGRKAPIPNPPAFAGNVKASRARARPASSSPRVPTSGSFRTARTRANWN